VARSATSVISVNCPAWLRCRSTASEVICSPAPFTVREAAAAQDPSGAGGGDGVLAGWISRDRRYALHPSPRKSAPPAVPDPGPRPSVAQDLAERTMMSHLIVIEFGSHGCPASRSGAPGHSLDDHTRRVNEPDRYREQGLRHLPDRARRLVGESEVVPRDQGVRVIRARSLSATCPAIQRCGWFHPAAGQAGCASLMTELFKDVDTGSGEP
jgi:hypothetical protein